MVGTLRKINKSKISIAIAAIGIFLLIFYCNKLTPLAGDDYVYMYSFYDETPIESISDIFVSMGAHRLTTNGRVIPHFFVQLFLMYPLIIFKVINSVFFVLFIFLIYAFAYKYSTEDKTHNALLLCTIFAVVWFMSNGFSKVFLWTDGAVNYLWSEVLFLLWLLPWVKNFISAIKMKPYQECLYALMSLAVGNYSENSAVAVVFMAMLFGGLAVFYKHEKISRWQITSFVFLLIGFFLLAFAPAELLTKISTDSSIKVFFERFLAVLKGYFKYWPLIISYVLSYILSVKMGLPQKIRVLSLVFIGGSLAGHFVLTFALYFEARSTYITLTMLLTACAILYQQLFYSKAFPLLFVQSLVCGCFALYWIVVGVSDIRTVNYRFNYNEEYIKSELAEGNTEIRVPFILPDTQYSALYLWEYLREDPNSSYSFLLERYYGADKITGYFFYDTVTE